MWRDAALVAGKDLRVEARSRVGVNQVIPFALLVLIVFTGANAPTTRDRFPGGEAVHYRQRAIELGVPPEATLIEPRATNTRENIEFSRQLLADRGIHPESAVFIC